MSKELLEEKEERIQHLEEVNRILKQTNDDLQEELREMRTKLDIVTAEVCVHACTCMCVYMHVCVHACVCACIFSVTCLIWFSSWSTPRLPVRHWQMNPRS